MTERPTRLAVYLKRTGTSHRAFATRAGIPRLHPMIGLWARGVRLPGLVAAHKIEAATDGEIPASYWVRLKVRAARARPKGNERAA